MSAVLSCFRDYIGLKVHFSEDMIWNRNMGKRLSEETLMSRKDYQFFQRLSYQIPDREERIQYFISCFLNDPDAWIGEMLDQEKMHAHKQRMRVVNALDYHFRSDVDNIVNFMYERKINVRELLLTDGQAPLIIREWPNILGGVTEETLALLDTGFKYCAQESSDPLWRQKSFLIAKYKYLLQLDNINLLKVQYQKLAAVETKSP
jgi:hypothetical protein